MTDLAPVKRRALRSVTRVLGTVPRSLSLFGVQSGYAEFARFPNSVLYEPTVTPRLTLKTVPTHSLTQIRLSGAPRTLKAGAILSVAGGIANRNGAIYTSDGDLVVSEAGIYEFVGDRLRAQPPKLLPRFLDVSSPVAALSSPQFNYFHWMHETLAKIHLLQAAGRDDVLLYLNPSTAVQRQTLALMGIDTSRVIDAAQHGYVRASELVVPNFATRIGMATVVGQARSEGSEEITVGNVTGAVGVADWTCAYLRNRFLDATGDTADKSLRIFISRSDAGKGRRVTLNRKVIDRIRELGFQTVALSGMRFRDQVRLFSNADVVIAPHGAGLTNLTFCRPGARCIELFSPRYISDLYAVLSCLVDVDYYYLVGRTGHRWNGRRSNEDFELDAGELEDLLRSAGITT